MQVSTVSIQQHYELPFQKLYENQSEKHREMLRERDLSHVKNPLNTKKREVHNAVMDLKEIQSDYNLALQSDSYLGKLQKVLKRFKELNQQIVDATITNKQFALESQLKELANEYPMLEEFTKEMGNLFVKSFLGGDNMKDPFNEEQQQVANAKQQNDNIEIVLGQLAEKQKELKSDIDSLGKLVGSGGSRDRSQELISEVKLNAANSQTAQKVHNVVTSEKAIALLN